MRSKQPVAPNTSRAAQNFIASFKEVESLRGFHEALTGTGRGYRPGMEVLNKSAIVLLCAIWEAYCEDLADEALTHILAQSADYTVLPDVLQRSIAKELKEDRHELSPWKLAGTGWKAYVHGRLPILKQKREFDFNTPKAASVEKFFEDAVGISKITDAWHWKHVSVEFARRKLDQLVTLRGSIAHRGSAGQHVKKEDAAGYLEHVIRLVMATDEEVGDELHRITSIRSWGGGRQVESHDHHAAGGHHRAPGAA